MYHVQSPIECMLGTTFLCLSSSSRRSWLPSRWSHQKGNICTYITNKWQTKCQQSDWEVYFSQLWTKAAAFCLQTNARWRRGLQRYYRFYFSILNPITSTFSISHHRFSPDICRVYTKTGVYSCGEYAFAMLLVLQPKCRGFKVISRSVWSKLSGVRWSSCVHLCVESKGTIYINPGYSTRRA